MEQTNKLVSVFVPYYNDRTFLCDCIDSILSQTYENFELVLLNHASTDGSDNLARTYSDPRIRHIALEKNLGAGGGVLFREFLNVAQGEYVKLFCADDIMHPDFLENFICHMKENPQIDIVFGNVEYVDEHQKSLRDNWFHNRPDFDLTDGKFEMLQKYSNGISALPYIGCFAKRAIFDTVVPNRTFIMLFDMNLWVELLLNDAHFGFMDKIVASYRIHEGQVSSIANLQICTTRSFYETTAYCDVFYNHIHDIDTLKKIFITSPFRDRLDNEDTDLIEFVIAHTYLLSTNISYQLNAYLRLERIFADERSSKRIEQKFDYGIKEFREDYSDNTHAAKSRFTRQLKELPFTQITRILLSKSWKMCKDKTLRKIGSNPRRRKKYTA